MASVSSGMFDPGSTSKTAFDLGGTWQGSDILNQVLNGYMSSARQYALEDRDWTAMREDSAIQRRVKDIQAAGLNPYLAIQGGLGEAASSASQVGAQTNAAMQMANSAASVLAQFASLPSKNFNNLSKAIKSIVDSIFNRVG